jgi:hypothetical protein
MNQTANAVDLVMEQCLKMNDGGHSSPPTRSFEKPRSFEEKEHIDINETTINARTVTLNPTTPWLTTRAFLERISERGNRIVFQLHSDPDNVFRSASLGGTRPHINQILDALAGSILRDLKYVYDYEGHRYNIGFADYVK